MSSLKASMISLEIYCGIKVFLFQRNDVSTLTDDLNLYGMSEEVRTIYPQMYGNKSLSFPV